MTRPVTSSRVLLVEDRRGAAGPNVVPLRRYRLALLRLESAAVAPDDRFEYLKQSHD